MALGSLPPWLNITPSQFLAATEAGTNAGQRIAEAAQRAWEEDQRMRMTQAQQAIENAAQRLAAERLEQYRRGELANAQARIGIEQQGLGLRSRAADTAEGRLAEMERHNQALEDAKTKAEEGKQYGDIEQLDLGGGARAVYRKGSPGLHIVTSHPDKGLSPTQATALLRATPYINAAMQMGTNSPMGQYVQPLLSAAMQGLPQPAANPTNQNKGFKIVGIRQRGAQTNAVPSVPQVQVDSTDEEDDTEQ